MTMNKKITQLCIFLLASAITACNNDSPATKEPAVDTIDTAPASPTIADSIALQKRDSLLLKTSAEILRTLKQKDFAALAAHIHPSLGVRLSPYAFIDTINHQVLSRADFRNKEKLPERVNWGHYDGSGDPILIGFDKYMEEFVYDEDFLNAPQKAVNQLLGGGNSLNNLAAVYPGCPFTEFYFPGIDPQYAGMDWVTLRLVFKQEKNNYYLVGIVHDQWTI